MLARSHFAPLLVLVAACSQSTPEPKPVDPGVDPEVTPSPTPEACVPGARTWKPLGAPAEASVIALRPTADALFAVTRYGVLRRPKGSGEWTTEDVAGFEAPVYATATASSADALYLATGKVVRRRDAVGWTELGFPSGALWLRSLAAAGDTLIAATNTPPYLFRRTKTDWVADAPSSDRGASGAIATNGPVVLAGSGWGSIHRAVGGKWTEAVLEDLGVPVAIDFVGSRVLVADHSGLVFRSRDEGVTFERVGALPFAGAERFAALGEALVAFQGNQLAVSKDEGATWTSVTTPASSPTHVGAAVVDGELLVASAGLSASSDLGGTWRAAPWFVASTPHSLSAVGDRLYTATLDGRTSLSRAGGAFAALDAANLRDVVSTPSGRLLALTSDGPPDATPNFLTGGLASSANGVAWTNVRAPFFSNASAIARVGDRLLLGSSGHNTTGSKAGGVASGGEGVWSSTNGVTWTAARTGLPSFFDRDEYRQFYGDVLALRATSAGVVASIEGEGVYFSATGDSWAKVAPTATSARLVAVAGTTVVAVSGSNWVRSEDGGATFTGVDPLGLATGTIGALHAIDGHLVVSVGRRVFYSNDGARSWKALGELPRNGRALAAVGTTLYAGTEGTGVHALDASCLP